MSIKMYTRLSILLLCGVLSGCISSTNGQQMSSNIYRSEFYVERQPKDERNLAGNIATILRGRGLDATNGEEGQAPDSAGYIVSYVDNWYWDMRMYLLKLKIEVRERETNYIVAYGESTQSSLAAMGKSHDDIINRALDEMINRGRTAASN